MHMPLRHPWGARWPPAFTNPQKGGKLFRGSFLICTAGRPIPASSVHIKGIEKGDLAALFGLVVSL